MAESTRSKVAGKTVPGLTKGSQTLASLGGGSDGGGGQPPKKPNQLPNLHKDDWTWSERKYLQYIVKASS